MKLLSFLILGSFLFPGIASAQVTTFSQKPFTDVPVSSSDFQAIEYLRTQNVVKGYMDGTFRPDTRINRAEFVEFAINPFILDTNGMGDCVESSTIEESTRVFFADVPKDAWFAENICFAKTHELIDGYPDGTFRPGDQINFVEAAKIIANVFSLNVDAYQVGEFWYRSYVQNLSDLYAIPTTIKRFDQAITRGQMAQIVYRLRVDSTQKTSMGFDLDRNILFVRAPALGPVTAPQSPQVSVNRDRPSRRGILLEAAINNNTRHVQ